MHLSSVCSGAFSWPAGQDATCSRDAQRFPGVPPNLGSACTTSVSLTAAHIAFSRVTAGGATWWPHHVLFKVQEQNGAGGGPPPSTPSRRSHAHTCAHTRTSTHAFTCLYTCLYIWGPWGDGTASWAHKHTRAHKWEQAPWRSQGPLPSARSPVPWPSLVQGSATSVSSPRRDPQPPARGAHGLADMPTGL